MMNERYLSDNELVHAVESRVARGLEAQVADVQHRTSRLSKRLLLVGSIMLLTVTISNITKRLFDTPIT